MRTVNYLGETLFGKTRGAILGLLLARPDEEFLVRQVSRVTGASLGPVQRELRLLADLGILKSRRVGTGLLYSAQIAMPVYTDLRNLVVKTVGVADVLRRALEPMRSQIRAAWLYGSFARGEQGTASDIDVLLAGDMPFAVVVRHFREAQQTLGRDVNAVVYPPEEFAHKLREKHYFLTTVMAGPKVLLIGDEHELFGMAEERLAQTARAEPARNDGTAGRRRAGPRGQRRSKTRR